MDNLQIEQLQALVRQYGEESNADFIQLIHFLKDHDTPLIESIMNMVGDESQRSGMREVACWVLGKTGAPQTVPSLVSALNSSSSEISEEAARSLGLIGNSDALQP